MYTALGWEVYFSKTGYGGDWRRCKITDKAENSGKSWLCSSKYVVVGAHAQCTGETGAIKTGTENNFAQVILRRQLARGTGRDTGRRVVGKKKSMAGPLKPLVPEK